MKRLLSIGLMLSGCFAAPAFAQNCDGWVPIGDPGWRRDAAATYEPHSRQIVLFGGMQDAVFLSAYRYKDTWTFDGRRWTWRPTSTTPTTFYQGLMAADPRTGDVVLTGGFSGNFGNIPGDTWRFDGEDWHQAAPGTTGPQANSANASFSWDSQRQEFVLTHTSTDGPMQLWRFIENTWSQTQPTAGQLWPPGVVGKVSSFDPVRQTLVVFGAADVWEYNQSTWTHLTVSVDGSGTAFSACYSPALGGIALVTASGIQVWNGQALAAVAPPPSSTISYTQRTPVSLPDGFPAILCDVDSDSTATYAGTVDVLRLGTPTPTVVGRRLAPSPRLQHSVAAWPGEGVLFTGGSQTISEICGVGGQLKSDTWILRGERWTLAATTGAGTPQGAPAVFDPAEGAVALLAGCAVSVGSSHTGSGFFVDGVWQPFMPAIADTPPSNPVNQWTVDTVTGRAWTTRQGYGTISQRVGGAWTTLTEGPTSSFATIAFDPVRGALIRFGDLSSATTSAFSFSTQQWQTLQTPPASQINMPYPGIRAPMGLYEPTRGGVIAFGGFTGYDSAAPPPFPSGTYLLPSNGSTWQRVLTDGPPGRKYSPMAYDTLSERVVLFGGFRYSTLGDTWKLARGPARVAVPPAALFAEAGGAATFEVVAKGGGAIRYQWRRNGVPLVENTRIDGVHTDLLTITDLRASDAGDYTCVVTNNCGTETSTAAHLTVNGALCAADLGAAGGIAGPDGALDNNDFIVFITYFFNADPHADMGTAGGLPGSDGALDNNDFIAFINAFFAGC